MTGIEAVEHTAISATIVLPTALLLPFSGIELLAAIGAGMAAGVLIDLDHFLLAAVKTGSLRHTFAAIRHPFTIVTDNQQVLEDVELAGLRMRSHLVLAMCFSTAAYMAWRPVTPVIALALAGHIAADLWADKRQ